VEFNFGFRVMGGLPSYVPSPSPNSSFVKILPSLMQLWPKLVLLILAKHSCSWARLSKAEPPPFV
jgi:hypothetical protein